MDMNTIKKEERNVNTSKGTIAIYICLYIFIYMMCIYVHIYANICMCMYIRKCTCIYIIHDIHTSYRYDTLLYKFVQFK
jgi:hypothetical protein